MTRPRRKVLVGLVLFAAAAAMGGGLFAALDSSGVSSPLVGRSDVAAPSFLLENLSGRGTISLRQFRGDDVVLNFWASWCIPCRTEMPLLEAAYRAHHQKVAFVGVDTNDTKGAALAFVRRVNVTYPSAFDPDGNTAPAYGLIGLPDTVFVASDGRIRGRLIGQIDASTLEAALEEAFAPRGS